MHDVQPAVPDTFPVLRVGDLLLREIATSDAAAWFRRGSDPLVAGPQMGTPMRSPAEAEAAVQEAREGFRSKRVLRWGIVLPGSEEVVGTVGYNDFFRFHRRAEIGYALERAYWGRGVMSAATQAVVEYGFAHLDLHRIEAIIAVGNDRSAGVAERCGFRREGTLRDFFRTPEGWVDAWFYAAIAG